MIYIGIDPGYSGAIALYWPEAHKIEIHDMPTLPGPNGKTELDMHGILNVLEPEDQRCVAYIEKVGAMPGQGVTSMFRFGEQFGALQMAVAASGIPLRMVTPAVWKKHFGLNREKGVSRGYAMRRFPEYAEKFSRVKDDGRAEAVLIALYAKENAR